MKIINSVTPLAFALFISITSASANSSTTQNQDNNTINNTQSSEEIIINIQEDKTDSDC